MLTVNQPSNHLVYTRSTTQQSTHPFRPPVYGDGELDIWYPWSETGALFLTRVIFTVVGVSSLQLSSNRLRYQHNISPTNMKYRTPFWHWKLPTCQGPMLKKIWASTVLWTSCRNIQSDHSGRDEAGQPPPPQECVCWTKHMWIYHRWQTKCTPPPLKDSFIPEQITTLIKNNENEGTLSSVVQMPQVYCLHPQRSSTCVWLCLWHKQIDLHENKRQKNVWYCSNMQRSCMWERSWQKTVCWLHLSLRLLRKSSRFLLIIHVRFNAS